MQLKIRNATAILVLSLIAAPRAMADTLPAYCGAVGAKSYTPPVVAIPAVDLNRGTVITVTNATVVVNGDTSSVSKLMANPGPDGISLEEAIRATNNNPGTWNIQFAPALKGSTIVVDTPPSGGLSPLTGGNVTINGDIDGSGQPGIALTSMSGNLNILIASSGNTVDGLALQNCGNAGCVMLRSTGTQPAPVTGKTFSNTTVSNLVMTNISPQGTAINICPNCGPNVTSPTRNTWDHVLITGNTITGDDSGPVVAIGVQVAWGDTLQHTTIANNKVVLPAPGTSGISFNAGTGLGAPDQGTDTVLDTRVINNSVTAPEGIAFRGTSVGSLFDGMQVIGNHVISSGPGGSGAVGMIFHAADPESGLGPNRVVPYRDNVMKNLAILANTVQETTEGIAVLPGQNASTNTAISNVAILGNTTINTQTMPVSPINGIVLKAGGSDGSLFVASGNSLSNVLVQANTIQSMALGNTGFGGGNPISAIQSAGIAVWAGTAAQQNTINGLAIANNEVNTPAAGVSVTGGLGSGTPPAAGAPVFPADNNVIAGAQIFCNQIDQIPTLGVVPSSGIKGINVISGFDNASGNQVQQVYIADNLVAGTLGGASTFSYLGSGGSGNTLTTAAGPTPAIALVANAEGESPVIAPNTWTEIKGVNLAPQQDALRVRTWAGPDFVNNQMPVQLDGVGVTVNGKSAYVYYANPSQVNVLTPPDAMQGTVNVVVSNNGVSSQTFAAQAQAISPSFFVFDGTHVVATHGDGTDIGPAALYPGLTTPAKPGETIVIYANGFGQTSTPVVSGSLTQSGTLTPLPVITIGGIPANVRFAGLNLTPGEFQFNVDVPMNLAAGDQPIVATYNGLTTQGGVVLTVGQ